MANTKLDTLKSQLYGLDEYTPMTEESARSQAESIYNPQYQQDLTSLRKTVESNVAQQGRNALSSGMQRSSYNQAAQASIRSGGLESEAQLAATKESNIASLIQQLLSADKDRETEAGQYRNQLLMRLYDYDNSGRSSSGSYSSSAASTSSTAASSSTSDTENPITSKIAAALSNAGSKLSGTMNSTVKNLFSGFGVTAKKKTADTTPHESVANYPELWDLLHN